MGELSGSLHNGGGHGGEEKGGLLLLQVSNRREVSEHLAMSLVGDVCLSVSVEPMCTIEYPHFWRPFTVTWRKVGVVRMPSWCPTGSSADCFS